MDSRLVQVLNSKAASSLLIIFPLYADDLRRKLLNTVLELLHVAYTQQLERSAHAISVVLLCIRVLTLVNPWNVERDRYITEVSVDMNAILIIILIIFLSTIHTDFS